MKKKLNFVISFFLIFVILAGLFMIPAASYSNDVETSSKCIMLLNLDTDTACYSKTPDRKRYAAYLSEILTFIVAVQNTPDPEQEKVKVTEDFIAGLSYTDGCLDQYVDKTLTLKDLLAIMMFTSGSDAANLIADTVTGGDVERFVSLMNKKAADLGCSNSLFQSPGYSDSPNHRTTCNDLIRMYKVLAQYDLYQEIMEQRPSYTPEGLDEKKYAVTTQNSLMNSDSPYYFRYCTGGKFSYDPVGSANLVVTTTYRGKSYIFVAMNGLNTSEKNTFADARRMTTWAYLNLYDRKVIDSDDEITTYRATAVWGGYEVPLFAGSSAYKTLPMAYDKDLFTYKLNVPKELKMPIFEGQIVGTAKVYYDGHKIDDINLIATSSEGVSLIDDVRHFGRAALDEIMVNEPPTEPETEPETQAPTEAPTAATAAKSKKIDAATEE